jgi:hypothetical protein
MLRFSDIDRDWISPSPCSARSPPYIGRAAGKAKEYTEATTNPVTTPDTAFVVSPQLRSWGA